MLIKTAVRNLVLALVLGTTAIACEAGQVAAEREELMEAVRDAVKPVGAMLEGDRAFDADTLQASLAVFADAGSRLGDLVPEGSEGGEAAAAIWEDPDGFAAAIQKWRDATAAAIDADPQTLDEAIPVVKPALGACKNCHDVYRAEDDY